MHKLIASPIVRSDRKVAARAMISGYTMLKRFVYIFWSVERPQAL
jgi:hypothetical protein